ncbi:extracellular matrix protein 1-like [Micropterus salmoides]|uniref:extracellular matrix protein 1-like n=1 Tax=Micropterus salmoides TaxID=27706 RepID=UPI0018ED5A95|nr:extracellular matrix protein 1-like [Micropterus salmoides]XP_038581514.1 extracellular matrix protein 1-like [Micropterus salmoides]
MISIGGLTGFWIIALLTLHGADVAETHRNSLNEPDVPFPPARPTAQNLAAICYYSQGRPRYLASFFLKSGASFFRRCGDAINRLESWYSLCCSGQVEVQSYQILCCTQQAWKQALSQFCMEEYATMTLPYECCAKTGEVRWKCFDSQLPNPNYEPIPGYTAPLVPQEPGFIFNANAC